MKKLIAAAAVLPIFATPKSIKLSGLKANEKVTVTYTMANGKMLATRVVAAK